MTETIQGWLPFFLQPIADFLNITIVSYSWIFLSMWSIVHLIVGGLIYYFARKYGLGRPMLLTIIILSTWEIFEVFMFYVTRMFIPEKFVDTLFDMILGIGGAVLVWLKIDHDN